MKYQQCTTATRKRIRKTACHCTQITDSQKFDRKEKDISSQQKARHGIRWWKAVRKIRSGNTELQSRKRCKNRLWKSLQ